MSNMVHVEGNFVGHSEPYGGSCDAEHFIGDIVRSAIKRYRQSRCAVTAARQIYHRLVD